MLQKTLEAYKLWHVFHQGFPRLSKYTLGEKIDGLFTELIEMILSAGYSPHDQKLSPVIEAIKKLDSLKAFVQIAWELKYLDHKQFASLLTALHGIGKDVGAWRKILQQKTPPA